MVDLQLRILFTHTRHYHKTIPYRQVKINLITLLLLLLLLYYLGYA